MIRILHQAPHIPELLFETLPGRAEHYRSLTGADAAVVMLLAEHELEPLLSSAEYREFAASASTEIYRQCLFDLRDDVWVSRAAGSPLVRWPARDQVRIIIQGQYAPNPKLRELIAREVAETRREPGCVAYDWYEHACDSSKLLLLEVWQDQQLYDAHWFGRVETADYRGDSGRTPIADSEREFYRRTEFDLLYGRFLPRNPAQYSHTVVWPDSC
ncbi:putative quinol monooxygenase [Corynebacterium sp.]|uniref:putative quinol monooxygenase n=1 Tax=Corynebacterium sp. TaxID=1720 RepID=UPI0026DC9117|nr:antibiotic biosynthesis monooxygenase [Corynebacterium sp.]MDO5076955.1 antibiotic biosynthesis monooxygenase [Corynebacterium sp.]